jgi:hypothetical protein
MAVGEGGIAVTTANDYPKPTRNSAVGAAIHRGSPESTVGGPGCTTANGASLTGSSGSSPYGSPATAG